MKIFQNLLLAALLVIVVPACTTAKNTGSTVKDATVTGAKEVGDKTEDAAEATADVAKAGAEKTEDASITSAIKMKFARDDIVSASDIDVDTDDGHVTLTGKVSNETARQRALALAREVSGVKSVTSRLSISQ